MRIELCRIRDHGGDNVALRFYVLVALKTDEVRDGLAGLQLGKEMDAPVSGAKSGSRKKEQPGNSM